MKQTGVGRESLMSGANLELCGKVVVFTGTFEVKRAEATQMATAAGATVAGSVSGKTDILIVGKEPGMSKVSKARAANVTLMSIHDLRLGIEGGDVDAAAKPMEISSFSAGFRGNGLAAIASDADLAAAVHAALQKKHFRHGGHGGAEDLAKHAGENRHMVRIGG